MKKTFFWPAVLSLAVISSPAVSHSQNSSPLLPIDEYDQIAAQHPNFAPVYFERGMARFSSKEYSNAIQDLSMAAQLRPNDADAHYMRGAVFLASGQLDQAVTDLDKAAELERKMFVEIYKMRGNLYLTRAYFSKTDSSRLADAEAAIKNFDEIVRLNPDCAEARYNRGRGYFAQAYFSNSSAEQAIADFDKALSLAPNFEAAQKELESALNYEQTRNGQINLN
jgi:tetratricopeptide (TPR) repeat protein